MEPSNRPFQRRQRPAVRATRAIPLVALGGGIGGTSRYLLGLILQWHGASLLSPSLAINAIGSFMVGGVLEAWLSGRAADDTLRLLFTSGFVGGFTTAAAFTPEVVRLMAQQSYDRATVYALASILLANVAAVGGGRIGAALHKRYCMSSSTD